MVVFTPKSMLRNKAAVSKVEDFTDARFQSVIDDRPSPPRTVSARSCFVSGKLYYELAAEQEKRAHGHRGLSVSTAVPVPEKKLRAIFDKYPNAHDVRWVRRSRPTGLVAVLRLVRREKFPERMGAIKRVSRRPMSAPSAGSSKVHESSSEG